jgi:hypothetical protein
MPLFQPGDRVRIRYGMFQGAVAEVVGPGSERPGDWLVRLLAWGEEIEVPIGDWALEPAGTSAREKRDCDECGSDYFADTSQMARLCPECAHLLYGYPNCDHSFADGRCAKCHWDGSRSDFIRQLADQADPPSAP